MSTITQSVQPIICPDPLDPNYGPSADNIPIVSGTPGAPVTIASIANGATGTAYTVAAALFPQPTGASYAYRFTFNCYINVGTVPTAGPIAIYIQVVKADTSTYLLAAQTCWLRAAGIWTYGSVTADFVPATGDSLRVLILNDTTSTISNVQVVPTAKGNGISLVSKASTSQLIFS